MLKFLLDEQISPAVGEGIRRRNRAVTVYWISAWEEGRLLGSDDELILKEAARQKLTLVTYDRKTIPPLLKAWAEEGRAHGGVIFVDQKTIPTSDFGGLIRGLEVIFQGARKWDWTDRIYMMRR